MRCGRLAQRGGLAPGAARAPRQPGRRAQPCRAQETRDESGSLAARASTARERLEANPAYQRLKRSSWKDQYTPSDAAKDPGPLPKHLLEGGGGDGTERIWTGAPDPRQAERSRAQGNGRPSPGPPGRPLNGKPPAAEAQAAGQGQAQAGEAGKPPSLASLATEGAASGGGRRLARQQRSSVRTTRVRFWVQFHAQFGQRMRLVGSHPGLGEWVLSDGVELQWSPNDMWNATVELPAGAIVEYKYVLLESDGMRSIAWQRGNNSVLAVGHKDDDVEVYDSWEASPASSVVAGGTTTTREGRLLAWASEIESLFASQRSELRKSRMELATAQEEARAAREESRRFRAELRASETERVKAEMKVKELSVANRMLRTQLADTTLSFRNALETTHRFLVEAEQAMLSQKQGRQPPPVTPLQPPAGSTGRGSSSSSYVEHVRAEGQAGPLGNNIANGAGRFSHSSSSSSGGGHGGGSDGSEENDYKNEYDSGLDESSAAPEHLQRSGSRRGRPRKASFSAGALASRRSSSSSSSSSRLLRTL